MGKYDDIINLPHHVSSNRPHMSIEKRAAQFAPFAALSGYGDSIEETGRFTCEKIELDEQHKASLDAMLNQIRSEPGILVRIVYFTPDMLKDGGEYITAEGRFKKIDNTGAKIVLYDNQTILIDDIYSISICQ